MCWAYDPDLLIALKIEPGQMVPLYEETNRKVRMGVNLAH